MRYLIFPDEAAALARSGVAYGALAPAGATVSPVWAGVSAGPITLGVPVSQSDAIAAINAKAASILAAGAPVSGGLHVALDDGSRADLSAMATTAVTSASGAVPWPESYQTGWISIENERIPLPTPAVGLGLAAAVGDHYAQVRQRARDLKDAVIAGDPVDIDIGWPGT